MHKLEEYQNSSKENPCPVIYDAMFMVHSMKFPTTYGDVAYKLLENVCSTSTQEFHLICDTYVTPSIKDTEHDNRYGPALLGNIIVTGPEQKT